jgi:hypothetical protein
VHGGDQFLDRHSPIPILVGRRAITHVATAERDADGDDQLVDSNPSIPIAIASADLCIGGAAGLLEQADRESERAGRGSNAVQQARSHLTAHIQANLADQA